MDSRLRPEIQRKRILLNPIQLASKPKLKVCKNGHEIYKSSDCPICPICEAEYLPKNDFLASIAAPARRALEREHIMTLEDLATWREQDILKLHGMGPSTIPKLKKALKDSGLDFK